MADKRTTPDPAEGARRRKRPAPTIDLTATEVSAAAAANQPQAAADEPQQPDPEHDEAEAVRTPEPSGHDEPPRTGPAAWQVLFAGFLGAAIMTAVLLAVWAAGLVPSRDAGPLGAEPASIAALNERMGRIETSVSRPANDPATSERLSAVDNALKSLGIALTALNKRSDEVASISAEARSRADAATNAMTQLRDAMQDLTKNTSAGLSPADVDTVQKRLAALEQAVNRAPTDKAARLALGAATLRDTVVSGASFTAELDEAKSLGADEKALAPLSEFATTGVLTAAALAQELQTLLPAMLKIWHAQAPEGSFLERLQANAGKLVRIRPMDAPPGDDPSAVLARLEVDAAKADIPAALADLAKLPDSNLTDVTRQPIRNWIVKARASEAALAAARQFAA
ncbi:MAG TPA: hypothetical protein VIV09_10380, partial [Pseudolabrys sp.]